MNEKTIGRRLRTPVCSARPPRPCPRPRDRRPRGACRREVTGGDVVVGVAQPDATIRTRTSFCRGPSSSTSMVSYLPGADVMTAPRVRMNCPLVWSAGVAVTPRQKSYQPGTKPASPGGAGFSSGVSAGLSAHRGHMDQEVVGHQRDGQVHEHEDDHGSDRLALGQYPQVGKEQHQRHQDGQAKEQPAGSR